METTRIEYELKIKALEKEVATLKKQQVTINEAKELYVKILDDFPAMIWRSDLTKLCNYFNKNWLEFSGKTIEQELGVGWAEGIHPDDFDSSIEIYNTAFDKQEAFVMEYRLKNRFGEYRWIRDFGRPFYDLDHTFLGYIGSCYDVTNRINNERELTELNATKNKFFSIISHDLKSPINTIIGLIELLNINYELYTADKIEMIINHLLKSAKSSQRLLENLLEWSRSQSNTIPFKPQKVNLIALCKESLENLISTANSKNINIKHDIINDIEIVVDKNMIKSVLRNLVSNAIKFSTDSTVEIHAKEQEQDVIISISDHGIGIDKESIEQLFSITKIQSTAGTAGEKGTGLGLILCKEFVERHNGKIWVESILGKGTTFKFSIPTQGKSVL